MSLGRGLGALITPTTTRKSESGAAAPNSPQKIWQIPFGNIQPNPNQPRKHFNPEGLTELSLSIKEHGILQPLLVTEKSDGNYELVAGERRLRASQLAGLATVPAIIKQLADQQKLEVALVENIQRQDLNPIEEAFAYKRFIDEFGLTQQEVADKVKKSRPAIANSVRLLDLPEPVQAALAEGKISMGQARALLSLDSADKQLAMLSSMLGEKITVRELEKKVGQQKNPTLGRRDPNLLYLEDKLRAELGTKVGISQKGDQGTITIHYYSKEELKKLVEKLGQ